MDSIGAVLAPCPLRGCIVLNPDQPVWLAGWFNRLLAVDGKSRLRFSRAGRISTGLFAVATAMAMCRHVDIFGFGLGLSLAQFESLQERSISAAGAIEFHKSSAKFIMGVLCRA